MLDEFFVLSGCDKKFVLFVKIMSTLQDQSSEQNTMLNDILRQIDLRKLFATTSSSGAAATTTSILRQSQEYSFTKELDATILAGDEELA